MLYIATAILSAYLYSVASTDMCLITVTICTECETEISSVFELCDEGKRGYVCVGPTLISNVPHLKILNNVMTSNRQADMATIAPSTTYRTTCETCSESCSRARPRRRS